jgi:hypothetical protein
MSGIDASIYQNLRPVEAPSMLDSAQKAMSLKSIGMQQEQMSREAEAMKMQQHLQKASAFGNALEGLSGMTEPERAAAYPKVHAELVNGGVITPEQAPAQYDPSFYRSSLMRYRQTAPAIEMQLKKSQIAENYAQAAAAKAKQNPAKTAFENLPPEKQELIKDTTKKASDSAMIRNMLTSDMKILQDPNVPEGEKLTHAKSMLKTLNSKLGKDVVGAEEASRLAPYLEAQGLKALMPGNPGHAFKTDLPAFQDQVQLTIDSLNDALSQSDDMVKKAYGGANPIAGKAYAAKERKGAGGGAGIQEAYADGAAPPKPTGVRMMGPDGKVRLIPADQVGEAIAAGGRKVKN